MRYKLLKRLQDGQKTVGFQLASADGKILRANEVNKYDDLLKIVSRLNQGDYQIVTLGGKRVQIKVL